MPFTALIAAALLATSVPEPAEAAPASQAPAAGPIAVSSPNARMFELSSARMFELSSAITHRTYKIYVSTPPKLAPSEGYPVLYVLDGDAVFPTAEAQARLSATCGGSPIVVVGVAYPDVLAAMTLRTRDLTPSIPDQRSNGMVSGKPEEFGGATDFNRFMLDELRPAIAQIYPIDKHHETLMGYSLGGLFALHVLFADPTAYDTYVIGSPSIWWNGKEVLEGEFQFAHLVATDRTAPRILITSDQLEQDEITLGPSGAHMVDNAKELAQRLQGIRGGAGYIVKYALLPGETHNTGIPASTSQGIAFIEDALQDAPGAPGPQRTRCPE